MTPKRFFIDAVSPAQWCVLSLGTETIRSARRSVAGRCRFSSRVFLPRFGVAKTSS